MLARWFRAFRRGNMGTSAPQAPAIIRRELVHKGRAVAERLRDFDLIARFVEQTDGAGGFRQKLCQMPAGNVERFLGVAAGLQQLTQKPNGAGGFVVMAQFGKRAFELCVGFAERGFAFFALAGFAPYQKEHETQYATAGEDPKYARAQRGQREETHILQTNVEKSAFLDLH